MNSKCSDIKIPHNLLSARPLIVAGPCSAESKEQVISTAKALKGIGKIDVFRAGLWKPRTHPGSFEGIGERGVQWLLEARSLTGLPIATEVAIPDHVNITAEAGFNMLWIGARTAADPFAMQALADSISLLCPDTPIFIKNPINPDLELWIGAIERLQQAGVKHIGAIHRGFSVYKSAPYRNSPIWQIPLELHRRFPQLPILHDPSHTGGAREHLEKLAQQALDMGFSGLMIESHPQPERALSDGGQQITPAELHKLLSRLKKRNTAESADNAISQLRARIDALDSHLLSILAQRMEVTAEIGRYKQAHNLPVVDSERYDRLLTSILDQGCQLGLSKEFLTQLLELIHANSVNHQLNILNQ